MALTHRATGAPTFRPMSTWPGEFDRGPSARTGLALSPPVYRTVKNLPAEAVLTGTLRRSADQSGFMVDWELPPPENDR